MQREFISSIKDWSGRGVLSVVGPTGSGKSALVLEYLSHQPSLQPLLVSVDSIALYRYLDIGSTKALGRERDLFEWVGLDLLNPDEPSSMTFFCEAVTPAIVKALQKSRPVLLLGGSHFYERALVEGRGPGASSDPVFQESLNEFSNLDLHQRLVSRDIRWMKAVHVNDRYRLSRFLDLSERQGLSFDKIFLERERSSEFKNLWDQTTTTLVVGLDRDVREVRARMRERLHGMFEQGWIEEVQSLLKRFAPNSPGLQSVGYAELVEMIQNNLSKEETFEKILVRHMQLAKKQRTWLRGLVS